MCTRFLVCLFYTPSRMNIEHLPFPTPFITKSLRKYDFSYSFLCKSVSQLILYSKWNVIYAFAHMHKITGTKTILEKIRVLYSCLGINIKDFSIFDPIMCAPTLFFLSFKYILSKIGFQLQLCLKRISSYHMRNIEG